jgi:hypothetical protein
MAGPVARTQAWLIKRKRDKKDHVPAHLIRPALKCPQGRFCTAPRGTELAPFELPGETEGSRTSILAGGQNRRKPCSRRLEPFDQHTIRDSRLAIDTPQLGPISWYRAFLAGREIDDLRVFTRLHHMN